MLMLFIAIQSAPYENCLCFGIFFSEKIDIAKSYKISQIIQKTTTTTAYYGHSSNSLENILMDFKNATLG